MRMFRINFVPSGVVLFEGPGCPDKAPNRRCVHLFFGDMYLVALGVLKKALVHFAHDVRALREAQTRAHQRVHLQLQLHVAQGARVRPPDVAHLVADVGPVWQSDQRSITRLCFQCINSWTNTRQLSNCGKLCEGARICFSLLDMRDSFVDALRKSEFWLIRNSPVSSFVMLLMYMGNTSFGRKAAPSFSTIFCGVGHSKLRRASFKEICSTCEIAREKVGRSVIC